MTDFDDEILRRALAPAREATPTDDEIARALTRSAHQRRVAPQGVAALTTIAVVLLCVALYATPPTRAAIEDLAGSFAAWVTGDETRAPGRALRADDDAPWWVRDGGGRLIAKNDGVALYVTRVRSAREGALLGFSYGGSLRGGVEISTLDTIDGWRTRFGNQALLVLGAPTVAAGPGDRFALTGVTARSVRRVELLYASGPSTAVNGVDGGFVLIGERGRKPREAVAYDADGRELGRVDVGDIASQR